MTWGAQIAKPRIPPQNRRRVYIRMGMVLRVSLALGFLARNVSQKLLRVNNRTPISIAAPRVTLCSERIQDTLRTDTSLTTVISWMHLTLPRPRSNWTDMYLIVMLLKISSARPRRNFTNMWGTWRIIIRCCSGWSRIPAPAVNCKRSRRSRKRYMIPQSEMILSYLATRT